MYMDEKEIGTLVVSGSRFDWTKWEDMGEVEDTTNKQNQTSSEELIRFRAVGSYH